MDVTKSIRQVRINSQFIIASLLASTATSIQSNTLHESIYIAPSIGFHIFENEYDLENDIDLGLGLGYQFGAHWAAEINYQQTNSKIKNSSYSVDVKNLHLDALYHFNNFSEDWGLYIPIGIGQQKYDISHFDDEDETAINAGLGLRYVPSQRFHFRSDLRVIYGNENDTVDAIVNFGFVYLFSKPKTNTNNNEAIKRHADSDDDGVADIHDKCADTATGYKVDTDGCKVIIDSDNDSITDDVDKCPDTEANTNIDEVGCPIAVPAPVDNDGDGVDDASDHCLNTAPESKVDETGCTVFKGIEYNLNVQFKNASDQIDNTSLQSIDEVGEIMSKRPDLTITLYGYTDSSGSNAWNQRLSEKRAQSIKNTIVQRHHIAEDRIAVVGKGEADPIADNSTAEGREINRRVAAKIKQ